MCKAKKCCELKSASLWMAGTFMTARCATIKVLENLLRSLSFCKKVFELRRKILIGSGKLIRRFLENFCFEQKFRNDYFVFLPEAFVLQRYSEAEPKNPNVSSVFSGSFMTTLTCLFKMMSTFLVLFLILISEARAECPEGKVEGTSTHTCIDATGTCGDNCSYTIDATGKMTISGSGNMVDYSFKTISGIYGAYDSQGNRALGQKYGNDLKLVVFADDSNISSIGSNTFREAYNLDNVIIPDSVTKIGDHSFSSTNLKTVTIPDSVTEIRSRVFSNGDTQNPTSVEQIIIPDSVVFIGNSAFGANFEQLENIEIICKGDQQKCANVLSEYTGYVNEPATPAERYPIINLARNISPASYENCTSTNFYWNGAECVRQPDKTKRTCCLGCKFDSGRCWRTRYTPAELAKVVGESNTILLYYK